MKNIGTFAFALLMITIGLMATLSGEFSYKEVPVGGAQAKAIGILIIVFGGVLMVGLFRNPKASDTRDEKKGRMEKIRLNPKTNEKNRSKRL